MVSRVSFQGLYGRVSLQSLHGGPNISGVQISRDSAHVHRNCDHVYMYACDTSQLMNV